MDKKKKLFYINLRGEETSTSSKDQQINDFSTPLTKLNRHRSPETQAKIS